MLTETSSSHKAVFVSRTKFLVLLPKASQGDSLAAFLASIQEIFSSYETAKHFKMRNNCARKGKKPPIMLTHIGGFSRIIVRLVHILKKYFLMGCRRLPISLIFLFCIFLCSEAVAVVLKSFHILKYKACTFCGTVLRVGGSFYLYSKILCKHLVESGKL